MQVVTYAPEPVDLREARELKHRKIVKALGYQPKRMLVYGNVALLDKGPLLWFCNRSLDPSGHNDIIEAEVEEAVLGGRILVTGIASEQHRRAAVVPLRWGAPRVLVLSCGLDVALGPDLDQEPFRAARLWRYKFDPATDLVFTTYKAGSGWINREPRVDRLIRAIVHSQEETA